MPPLNASLPLTHSHVDPHPSDNNLQKGYGGVESPVRMLQATAALTFPHSVQGQKGMKRRWQQSKGGGCWQQSKKGDRVRGDWKTVASNAPHSSTHVSIVCHRTLDTFRVWGTRSDMRHSETTRQCVCIGHVPRRWHCTLLHLHL